MSFEVISQALIEKGYTVSCFEKAAEAAKYLDSSIHQTTVGFGGSVTLKEMGLFDLLSTHNDVRWHNRIPEGKTDREMRDAAQETEIYITSANGVAETGEIINIDATGNRVAESLYGHKKVYFVIGVNKIAPDYDSALYRARNVAGPLNAMRLGKKTPCAVKGDRCYDCKSPDRICNSLVVFWRKPWGCDYEIVLVNENLGY